MEELHTPHEVQPIHAVLTKKSHGLVINLTGCVIVVLALLTGVYVWQQHKVSNANATNTRLTSQLHTAQSQLQTAQTSAAASTKATKAEQVIYKAIVGKFTLTLPSKYAIIVDNDGAGEGGPNTGLTIGESTSRANIVTNSGYTPLTVGAAPLHGRTFRNAVDTDTEIADYYKKSTTTVDGVNAETYMIGGMGASKIVYFTKNDILYKISYDNGATETANPALDDVIAGFKFN